MDKVRVSIAGGSGYAGGELLRLLLNHPLVEIVQVTSESNAGKFVWQAHPNLRKRTGLKFSSMTELSSCDVLFVSLPHGESMKKIPALRALAPGVIDLSADFRLKNVSDFERWYKVTHAHPELLHEFVYGIPEIHREDMKQAQCISSAGCNATAVILQLYPLFKNNLIDEQHTVVEVKAGSSEGGNSYSPATHHPERSNCVRSYKPTAHRHIAEMLQELNFGKDIAIHFSATSIDMVRGILATSHVFLKDNYQEKDIWNVYRQEYQDEPFIRIVKERDGNYRYPEPKILIGSNYCDIGFEKDPYSRRLVVMSALDNLMKGAAGQAIQAFNIMNGFEETMGLEFPGLHPI
jgi:[amino group carrier protein]-6-phospho-L-2-aminoadipate/5-phospho-L-glutamate reductase